MSIILVLAVGSFSYGATSSDLGSNVNGMVPLWPIWKETREVISYNENSKSITGNTSGYSNHQMAIHTAQKPTSRKANPQTYRS